MRVCIRCMRRPAADNRINCDTCSSELIDLRRRKTLSGTCASCADRAVLGRKRCKKHLDMANRRRHAASKARAQKET